MGNGRRPSDSDQLPTGRKRSNATTERPVMGRSRANAVVQKPHLTRFANENELTTVQNMGRSRAMSPASRTTLEQNISASQQSSSLSSSSNTEENRNSNTRITNPKPLNTTEQYRNHLSDTLLGGPGTRNTESQLQLEKRNAAAFDQMSRNEVSRLLHQPFQGVSSAKKSLLSPKESLNQIRSENADIKSLTETSLQMKGRMEENNQEAVSLQSSADNWSGAARGVATTGKIATVATTVLGGGPASGLVGAGATFAAGAMNEVASRKYQQSAESFEKNVDTQRTGAGLLDSNISGGMAELNRANADKSHGKAKGQMASAAFSALGNAPGVDSALGTGLEKSNELLRQGVNKLGEGLDLKYGSKAFSSTTKDSVGQRQSTIQGVKNADVKAMKAVGAAKVGKEVTKHAMQKTGAVEKARAAKSDVINNMNIQENITKRQFSQGLTRTTTTTKTTSSNARKK